MSLAPNTGSAEQAAIILLLLQEEEAVAVLQTFNPAELQQISSAMAKLKQVAEGDIQRSAHAFLAQADRLRLPEPSAGQATRLLQRAVGERRASCLLEQEGEAGAPDTLEAVHLLSADKLWEHFKDEPAYIIAALLHLLDKRKAAAILLKIGDDQRALVLSKLVACEEVATEARLTLAAMVEECIDTEPGTVKRDGIGVATALLGAVPSSVLSETVATIGLGDEHAAARLRENLFGPETILRFDKPMLNAVIAEIDNDTLLRTLAAVKPGLRENVFALLPTRAAENLRDEVDLLTDLSAEAASDARRELNTVVWRLIDEGALQFEHL